MLPLRATQSGRGERTSSMPIRLRNAVLYFVLNHTMLLQLRFNNLAPGLSLRSLLCISVRRTRKGQAIVGLSNSGGFASQFSGSGNDVQSGPAAFEVRAPDGPAHVAIGAWPADFPPTRRNAATTHDATRSVVMRLPHHHLDASIRPLWRPE